MTNFRTASFFLALAGVTLVVSAVFAEQTNDKTQYTIKQDRPSLGTSMKKVIVFTGTIPLDKTYDQLTTEEQNTLKENYENMPAGDEPPFPLSGLMPIYKAIGRAHEDLRLKYKGKLVMYVLVDSEGNPKSVSVETSPFPSITQATAYVLMLQKFKPAVCSGKPCSMQFPVTAELVGPIEEDLDGQTPGVMINKANTM
jgi:hypothetical protein